MPFTSHSLSVEQIVLVVFLRSTNMTWCHVQLFNAIIGQLTEIHKSQIMIDEKWVLKKSLVRPQNPLQNMCTKGLWLMWIVYVVYSYFLWSWFDFGLLNPETMQI